MNMVEDLEMDDAFSITTERTPGKYLSTEDMDHLTYLEERLSVFAHEEEDRMGEWRLVCASCGALVTRVSEGIEVLGRHHHDFPYYNKIVRLGCYRRAPGCVGVDRISNGYSWFRGYAWQIQLCRNCHMQLGWKYMSPDESFYGLVFKLLREEKPGESNGAAS